MLDLHQVVSRLQKEPRGRIKALAGELGIDYWTLRRILKGRTRNPRIGTVEKLSEHYERHNQAA